MKQIFLLICILLFIERCGSKRGGISIGRGSSNRGMGGARIKPPTSRIGGYPGRSGASSGGFNRGRHMGSGGGYNQGRRGHGGTFGSGGIFGSKHKPRGHSYSRSGIGSFVRSNRFKNAIVGAAAGYLTYQAGKALIRSAMAPMMWNNRNYYWGSNYYRGGSMGTHMCRMPIDQSDTQFGNVYFEDGVSRPKEIVWSCDYYEYCCGYECCSRGGVMSAWGFRFGLVVLLMIAVACIVFLCCKIQRGFNPAFRGAQHYTPATRNF